MSEETGEAAVEEEVEVVEAPQESEEIKFAIIFELEQIAAKGREVEYGVLKGILDEKGKNMSPADFSRYCIRAKPDHYVDELLKNIDAAKLSSPKLAEDVNSGVAMHFTKGDYEISPGFAKLIDYARKNDFMLAAITALPESVYAPLLEKLAIGDALTVVPFGDVDPNFPRADAFLKVSKELGLPPRHCTSFVSTSSSAKAALTAGMRCVVVPDAYTSFQDFGGAQAVVDSLDDLDFDEVLAVVAI